MSPSPAATNDPVAFFTDVAARHPRCFWLDGGGAREWSGRRSLIGWLDDDDVSLTYSAARREVTRHQGGRSTVVGDDVFTVLEAELDGSAGSAGSAASEGGQWFGYLGYACRPDLPARPDPDLPDAVWMRPGRGRVRLFEHEVLRENLTFSGDVLPENVRNPRITGDSAAASPPYATAYARVQEELHAGNTYEANLTYRVRQDAPDDDPAALYLRLRGLNPAPYAGFLQHDVTTVPGARAWLLSSSPERYALITADRTLETKPIKGTTPRGATAAEDERQRHELATHPKYRAENLMIVDLLRNDLAQVCEVGSVEVPHLMQVESYATVHQLVSTVRGRLRDDVSTVAALRALFPAGSMTGAPKLRTMEIIDAVEETPRGAYAGAFGWISADGRADLGVVIRSLMTAGTSTAGTGSYVLGTGGGITVQSELQAEWDEARLKAERLLRAIGGLTPR